MGPLHGIRVIEVEGIGPCPFAGMLLADMGADVVRIGRPRPSLFQSQFDVLHRGKRSAVLDLKSDRGRDALLKMVERADVVLEGYRPGVMERFGLGPEACLARNARVIFGRMTGWGQDGPMAQAAGHDINYIGLVGALHAIGRTGERPTVPLNLVADFGGGGVFLAFGVVAALVERASSGKGQVVDAAMIDGVAALMAPTLAGIQNGFWREERGANLLDSGAPFYDTYETSDGGFMAVGALEPQFYQALVDKLGIAAEAPPAGPHLAPPAWPPLREKLEAIFITRTRDEWTEVFQGLDACVTPVLSATEALEHPHHKKRGSFPSIGGVTHPRPAPRFSRTSPDTPSPATEYGSDTAAVLREYGLSDDEVALLCG